MRTHVKALKYIILIFTFILLAILLVYTQPQTNLVPLLQEKYGVNVTKEEKSEKQIISESLQQTKPEDVKQTVMSNPNFLGEDVNKKLWKLKATRAVQTGVLSTGVTQLIDVVANTLSAKNSKVDYSADKGDFISKEEKVVLTGNVIIKSKDLTLKTENLTYDLKTTYAESPTQVDISADFGNIIADSMKSYDNAELLELTGNVRAKLYEIKK